MAINDRRSSLVESVICLVLMTRQVANTKSVSIVDQTVGPLNTVAYTGHNVLLWCSNPGVPTAGFKWENETTEIVQDCSNDTSVSPFQVSTATPNSCSLLITNVTLEQAGTYRCTALGSESASAELVVIEKMNCFVKNDNKETPSNDTTVVVHRNETLTVTCEWQYASSDVYIPFASWTSNFTGDVNVTDYAKPTVSSRQLKSEKRKTGFETTMTTSSHLQKNTAYTTSLQFKPKSELSSEHATNDVVIENEMTMVAQVADYSPYNIRITINGYSTQTNVVNIYVGDTITCYADAIPTSTYRWVDNRGNTFDQSITFKAPVTSFPCTCWATNYRGSAYRVFYFTVSNRYTGSNVVIISTTTSGGVIVGLIVQFYIIRHCCLSEATTE